ncbi:MAG: hypothetical protein K6T88_13640 [Bacillus sp. (in: Bacteria)]|nr:hypothetical protein [Bacillus sp. (in: firmicutes)]
MRGLIEGIERSFVAGTTPTRNAAVLGLVVGTAGVVLATYGLLKGKGMPGGLLDGVKVGANCPVCRAFWTSVGIAIIGTIWTTYAMTRVGEWLQTRGRKR